MFCPECGTTLPKEAKFCTKCGALTAREDIPNLSYQTEERNTPEANSVETETPIGNESQDSFEKLSSKRKNPRKTIAIVAAILLVVCMIGGITLLNHADDVKHAAFIVKITPEGDEFDVNEATPLPVHAIGTDEEGNSVDEWFYVTPDNGIELNKGTYTIEFPDPIATKTGTMHSPEADSAEIIIGDDGCLVGDEPADEIKIPVRKIASEDITDEMIEQLKEWLGKAGLSNADIDIFVKAVTNARQERLDQIAAEEEAARKAAEEEAAQKAAEEAAKQPISYEEACSIALNYYLSNNAAQGGETTEGGGYLTTGPNGEQGYPISIIRNDGGAHVRCAKLFVTENGQVYEGY